MTQAEKPGKVEERSVRRTRLLKETAARSEPIMQQPIWVYAEGSSNMTDIYRLIASKLTEGGCSCTADLQTDPHKKLKLLDFFEVRKTAEGKRDPELLGVVSLFGNPEACVVKISQ